jgi:hypothetical protein
MLQNCHRVSSLDAAADARCSSAGAHTLCNHAVALTTV